MYVIEVSIMASYLSRDGHILKFVCVFSPLVCKVDIGVCRSCYKFVGFRTLTVTFGEKYQSKLIMCNLPDNREKVCMIANVYVCCTDLPKGGKWQSPVDYRFIQ